MVGFWYNKIKKFQKINQQNEIWSKQYFHIFDIYNYYNNRTEFNFLIFIIYLLRIHFLILRNDDLFIYNIKNKSTNYIFISWNGIAASRNL